jgi:hypothetical protein
VTRELSLAYVDEAYTQALYFVGAVVVHGGCALDLQQELDDVVAQAARRYDGIKASAELHGYDLFHGCGEWAVLRQQPRARIGVYQRALSAIGTHDVSIFLCGVHRKRLSERYRSPLAPHDVTLQHLLERLDGHGKRTGGPVLVIADEISEHERHRTNLQRFRLEGTPGFLSTKLSHILDTVHFAPSRHSRFLQAVDLITFMHQRRVSGADTDSRAIRANVGRTKAPARMRGA